MPVRGPCRNIVISFGIDKLEYCDYPTVKTIEDLGGKRAQMPFCKIWENALKVSQT